MLLSKRSMKRMIVCIRAHIFLTLKVLGVVKNILSADTETNFHLFFLFSSIISIAFPTKEKFFINFLGWMIFKKINQPEKKNLSFSLVNNFSFSNTNEVFKKFKFPATRKKRAGREGSGLTGETFKLCERIVFLGGCVLRNERTSRGEGEESGKRKGTGDAETDRSKCSVKRDTHRVSVISLRCQLSCVTQILCG